MPAGGIAAFESVLQSYFDSTSRIIKNMVMSPDERHILEERREKLEKLRENVKERKLDEREIRLELSRIMSEEDRKLLESAEAERTVYS